MALEKSLKQHRRESETESRKTFNIRVCFAFFALSIEQDMELQDVEGRRMDDQSGEAGECTCRNVQGWRVFARRFNATWSVWLEQQRQAPTTSLKPRKQSSMDWAPQLKQYCERSLRFPLVDLYNLWASRKEGKNCFCTKPLAQSFRNCWKRRSGRARSGENRFLRLFFNFISSRVVDDFFVFLKKFFFLYLFFAGFFGKRRRFNKCSTEAFLAARDLWAKDRAGDVLLCARRTRK